MPRIRHWQAAPLTWPKPIELNGGVDSPHIGGDVSATWRTWLVMSLLLAVAVAIGLSAIDTLPPDEHEVLVLRTAQEMRARGDWIVPYFNGEPRLKKPPVSYWVTGLTATLAGADGRIAVWHGRLPSLLAGVGMTLLILIMGRRVYSPAAAYYAAAMFVTSAGYFSYVHDARPDLLYAFFCSAGLSCAAVALLRAARARPVPIYLMWLSYGLACLTKGPQIPFMLLAATLVFAHLQRSTNGGIRALRPLSGLALMLLVSVPWWVALHYRLDPAAVDASQLSGRLLVPQLRNLFNGYYLYRPLQLVLPWLPLIPIAWILALTRQAERRQASLFFGLAILSVVVGLSFGGQQRYFYLLPVLPAMFLLAGQGLARLPLEWPRLSQLLWVLQGLIIVVAVAWLHVTSARLLILVILITAAAAIVIVGRQRLATPQLASLGALVLLLATSYIQFADGETFWSSDRHNKHVLGQQVAAAVPANALLVTLKLTPEVYVFEAQRTIPKLPSLAALEHVMRERGVQEAYVLMEMRHVGDYANTHDMRALTVMPKGASDRAGLYRYSTAKNRLHEKPRKSGLS